MKSILSSIIFGVTTVAQAQIGLPKHDWKATLHVVDEAGRSIPKATARIYYRGTNNFSGPTDSNGVFAASNHDSVEQIAFEVEKPGYYPFRMEYSLGRKYNADQWNPKVNVALRKIVNPIAMYAKRLRIALLTEDKSMGLDLETGDWVAPLGKGKNADLFFTIHRKVTNDYNYDCSLTVAFPNKGDGLVTAPVESYPGSAFRTSRTAVEGQYEPEFTFHYTGHEQPEPVFGYFIRVRTLLDDNGQVKSALYGKIPGGFNFSAGTQAPQAGLAFNYYLNPTPNDRNLEFDPKKNLMKNLKFLEDVKEP